jgi:hypothetical protein
LHNQNKKTQPIRIFSVINSEPDTTGSSDMSNISCLTRIPGKSIGFGPDEWPETKFLALGEVMKRVVINGLAIIVLAYVIGSAAVVFGQDNLPTTPIAKVLNYKSGLALTDSQIRKLTILDNTTKEKMIQAKAQAQIRKQEIDKFTSNWVMMNGVACCQLVKEYYQYLAELKTLEINAIMQARAVLTEDQLRKFRELASLESMMLNLEPPVSSAL